MERLRVKHYLGRDIFITGKRDSSAAVGHT